MTLRQLIQKLSAKKLANAAAQRFPKEVRARQKIGYLKVIDELLSLPTAKPGMPIDVARSGPMWKGDETWVSVALKNPKFDPTDSSDCLYHAISYEKWSNIIDSKVVVHRAAKKLAPTELKQAAEILWEITWNGYSQKDIEKKVNKLFKYVEKALAKRK